MTNLQNTPMAASTHLSYQQWLEKYLPESAVVG